MGWSWRRVVDAHFEQWIIVVEIYDRRTAHQRQGHGKVASFTEVDGSGSGCRHIQHLLLQVEIQDSEALLTENLHETWLGEGRKFNLELAGRAGNRLYACLLYTSPSPRD